MFPFSKPKEQDDDIKKARRLLKESSQKIILNLDEQKILVETFKKVNVEY